MFTDKLWITNGVKKVKNPVKYQGVTDIYQGQINPNYDFKHQTLNFLNIKNSLEPFNIYPTDIYLGMRAGKSLFTVCFSNPDIFWSKYEGEGYGSGQNFICYKSHKINTTLWAKLTYDDLSRIFEGVEPNTIIQQRLDIIAQNIQ